MPIQDLVAKYLLTPADVDGQSTHPLVPTFANSKVTPLIDGASYFAELYEAIASLEAPATSQAIYVASWNFTDNFTFAADDGIHPARLVDLLGFKAAQGADVRVLLWVNDFVLATGLPLPNLPGELAKPFVPHVNRMTENLRTVRALRSYKKDDNTHPLADRVIINTLDHPYGAVHTKFVLIVDGAKTIGFTGGIDPVPDRFSRNFHGSGDNFTDSGWHDVMAKVEGDATQAMYDFFRSMWNALAAPVTTAAASPRFRLGSDVIAGVPVGSTLVPTRTVPSGTGLAGTSMRVQSLRTLPNMHRPLLLPLGPSFDFAPDGLYETEHALRKAIAAAETYIYVEDQTMQGRAAFGWLNAALRAKENLHVVLLTGQLDPADPPPAVRNSIIRDHLTAGLSESQLRRIVYYEHQRAVVHSKLWLIDDCFALIGSANIFDRGMYIEIEHGVSLVDEGASNVVSTLRHDLWGEHFRLAPADRSELDSLETSLGIWNPAWRPTTPPVPTFILPEHTDDFTKFTRPWGDGPPATFGPLNQVPSLTPLSVLVTDPSGQPDTKTVAGHTYRKWRRGVRRIIWVGIDHSAPDVPPEEPGPATAVGRDFIDDPMLPWNDAASGTLGLVDEWIAVFHAASDTTFIRKLTGHIERRIFFAPLPPAISVTVANLNYALLTPVLRQVPLPPEVPFDPTLPFKLLFHDWLGDPIPW